ncbi:MAG TPA: DNA repair protein RadA [Candidatus Sumerlaeota bacterium]|nr:DNA repair protein RadA [Candidatus Sumerlaeota bacterium]
MARKKVEFVCESCGFSSLKWEGRCGGCGEWNTMQEVIIEDVKDDTPRPSSLFSISAPVPVSSIPADSEVRIQSRIGEFDRILGGGLVPGSVTLIGGEPGIGKSTLMLQVLHRFSEQLGVPTLYVTGEESLAQIRMRAERLGALSPLLHILVETQVDRVANHLQAMKPAVCVIDSIQTLYASEIGSVPGSVTQLRECSVRLLYQAKSLALPMFFIGHVTKAGIVAGPRILEHLVDTVLYFEGERHHTYRILRAVKNRFGSTNEIGIFEMTQKGLSEVTNPSACLLEERPLDGVGSVVCCMLEGTRPLLIELQSLTSYNGGFGAPRRTTSGVDQKRVALLLAVLEKRIGLIFVDQDVFVNAAGGIRVDEPAADLAIMTAIVSSFRNRSVDHDLMILGEVGLSGEIRSVTHFDRRLKEGERLGFRKCLTSRSHVRKEAPESGIEIIPASNIREALDLIGLV